MRLSAFIGLLVVLALAALVGCAAATVVFHILNLNTTRYI